MSAEIASGATSTRALAHGLVVPASLLAALTFAYRGLFDYDPDEGLSQLPDAADALFFSPTGGSSLLIAVVTCLLVYTRRYRMRDALGAPALALPSGIFLAIASGLCLWSHYTGAADLQVVSLIFAILGMATLLGGRAGFASTWVPALFLLLLVPLPAVVTNQVVFTLQIFTAKATYWVLQSLGLPSALMGDLVLTPTRIFQVIESCSGIRSIETLTMSAVLYSELFYRQRLQVAILVATGPLLGVFVNQLRVMSLVMNPYSYIASVHTAQGIAMLVVGVLLQALIDRVLGGVLRRPTKVRRYFKPVRADAASLVRRVVGVCGLFLLLGSHSLWLEPWSPGRSTAPPLFTLRPVLGAWSAKGIPIDQEYLGTVGFTESFHRRYVDKSQPDLSVDVFIALNDRLHRRRSLQSEKTGIPGSGFQLASSQTRSFEIAGRTIAVSVYESRSEMRLVYHWYEGVEAFRTEALRALFALDHSRFRRPERSGVVRLSTLVPEVEGGLEQADARIQSLLSLLLPQLDGLWDVEP